jgi:hypothetical protein
MAQRLAVVDRRRAWRWGGPWSLLRCRFGHCSGTEVDPGQGVDVFGGGSAAVAAGAAAPGSRTGLGFGGSGTPLRCSSIALS